MAHRTKFTPKKRQQFLDFIAQGHTASFACQAIGMSRVSVYEHRREEPEFFAAWEKAYEAGTEVLENEARRRAVEGVVKETPIYKDGFLLDKLIETKYSDTLLIFLLKARAPDKYREKFEHKVTGEGAFTLQIGEARSGDQNS